MTVKATCIIICEILLKAVIRGIFLALVNYINMNENK